MKRKSETQKILAVRDYHKGKKVADICREYNCAKSTFYTWVRPYTEKKNKYGTVRLKDLQLANDRIRKLENELEIIRNSSFFKELTMKDKKAGIDEQYGKYSVHELCDAFSLSTGTYYNHLFRNKNEKAWYVERRAMLSGKIADIFNASRQTYGIKRVRHSLQQQGITISEKLVSELMREMGLSPIQASSKANYKKAIEQRRIDRLKQKFDVREPNTVWASDMTCFDLNGHRMYICVYLDLYSRKVLAYNHGRNPSTNLATRTITEAIRKEQPGKGLIVHTDNGGPYVSYSMSKIAARFGITQSCSHPGTPHDNAVAEAFFRTLKKECIYRNNFKSEAEFKKELDSYIDFYNNQREQHYLRYHSPVQFELQMT